MTSAALTPESLARFIDHTLLKPEATAANVEALIDEAVELGTYSVCISPTFAGLARRYAPDSLKVAAVCGFPSGKHSASVKAHEAAELVDDGVDEIDMVLDIGAAKAGLFAVNAGEISAVRAAAPDVVLKVIIESAVLTDEEIVGTCLAAADSGADFVKTSTGFHPSGGASVHAVALMHATVPGLHVKASGGIRDWDSAVAMIAAGATRLGVSSSRAILGGATATGTATY